MRAPLMRAGLARPDRDINHVLAYGQSLSSGWEGWPALSRSPPLDSLMLGDSVRPVSESAAEWRPVGSPVFRPLAATNQDLATGACMPPDQVAGLEPGSLALGETVVEAAVNVWRQRMLAQPGASLGRHRLLGSSCGVGGRTIEQLARGAAPDLFQRLRDCATQARDLAAADGQSYGITALLFLQGEHNSRGLSGGTASWQSYAALLQQFYSDFSREIAGAIAGQTAPPAMFIHQTGGDYATDEAAISLAQLDVGRTHPGVVLVAPSYPVTSKGGHLDANGYRWLGSQFGKVMHRVLTLGEDWQPLQPVTAELAGDVVSIGFQVPVPPLRWGRPFQGHMAVDFTDKGFTVIDEHGVVPVGSVELAGPTHVRIALARSVGRSAVLRYADRSLHGGRGCLHDSDPELADDVYEYDPSTGHYPSANLSDHVGRRYSLVNWCVAFTMPISAFPATTNPVPVAVTREAQDPSSEDSEMPVTPDDVTNAYRWLLGREPSDQERIVWLGTESRDELRRNFVASTEFRSATLALPPISQASATAERPPRLPSFNEVEWQADAETDARLTDHIQRTWLRLGEEKPHWSVLSADRFLPEKIEDHSTEFYASAAADVDVIVNILRSNSLDIDRFRSVVEYGCGVGRATAHLAEKFPHVTAIDISESHLALARQRCAGLPGVRFEIARMPEFGMTGPIDLWFSYIVLQHNPPPIIARILVRAFKLLAPGGVAIFQVPTWCDGYRFRIADYLASRPAEPTIEVHCLPQRIIFDLAGQCGCVPIEVRTDGAMGPPSAWRSNLLVFRKYGM